MQHVPTASAFEHAAACTATGTHAPGICSQPARGLHPAPGMCCSPQRLIYTAWLLLLLLLLLLLVCNDLCIPTAALGASSSPAHLVHSPRACLACRWRQCREVQAEHAAHRHELVLAAAEEGVPVHVLRGRGAAVHQAWHQAPGMAPGMHHWMEHGVCCSALQMARHFERPKAKIHPCRGYTETNVLGYAPQAGAVLYVIPELSPDSPSSAR
jgi:hypothetical protein